MSITLKFTYNRLHMSQGALQSNTGCHSHFCGEWKRYFCCCHILCLGQQVVELVYASLFFSYYDLYVSISLYIKTKSIYFIVLIFHLFIYEQIIFLVDDPEFMDQSSRCTVNDKLLDRSILTSEEFAFTKDCYILTYVLQNENMNTKMTPKK